MFKGNHYMKVNAINTAKEVHNENYPAWLVNFIDIYQSLGVDNTEMLANVYAKNIQFIDPLHEVNGYQALQQYFSNLYTHLSHCDFEIIEVLTHGDAAAIYWHMSFSHKKLNKGKMITVEGHSHIKGFKGKVYYHRDYLDVGAMLYEHIPLLGKVILNVKKRASQ